MTKILIILLLISISLNGTTRSLAKLELACSMGNEDACSKISGHAKPKKNLIQTNDTTKANPSIKNDTVSVPTESSSNSKSPNTYNSLGKELAFFKKDCIIYENATLLPRKIRNTCKKYVTDVDKAFKLGYQLDKYNDSDTTSEKQLNRYLKMLRNADKKRENLITTIKKEMFNARTSNNAKYYNQLILGNYIRLKAKDYAFMMQYPDDMKDNPKYIKYVSMLEQKKRDKQARKKAEELKKKKERKEHHEKILAKAKKDLEEQIKAANIAKEAGEYFTGKKGNINTRYDKALLLSEKACNMGNADSCLLASVLYKNYKKNNNMAVKFDKKGCDKNNVDSCVNMASEYLSGTVVKLNYKKAFRLAKLGCTKGNQLGCMLLGDIYNKGKGVKKDYAKAILYYEKSCYSTGVAKGCARLALMYELGKGVSKNLYKANEIYKRGCDKDYKNFEACGFLGMNYLNGNGVNKNIELGKTYIRKACSFAPISEKKQKLCKVLEY